MTTLSADDSYLNHYGFSHDPFAARVPGFKFFPAQRKPVLGQLHHLARYSQLLLVVTGPEGSGKTLVRQALVASSNKQSVQSVVITPQDTFDSNHVLQQVAQALGSPRADFEAIMAQVIQMGLTGQEVYLLVDDAERLTGAAVETLLRLAVGSPEGRPHVFLFGQQSLVGRLEALVEGEERFHVIALQPYELEETREYLAMRLEGAGSGLDCLSEEQIARIYDVSGGWPGSINEAARDELLDAMEHSKAKRSSGLRLPLPMKHLLAVLAVLAVVAVAFLMRGGDPVEPAPSVTSLPLGANPAAESDVQSAQAEAPVPASEEPIVREPLAASGAPELEGDGEEAGDEPAAAPSIPEPAPQVNEPAPAVVEETPAPRASAPEPVPPAEPKAPQRSEPVRQDVAEPAPADSGWYASQPAGHYLVQVLGTRDENNAKGLVRQHGSGYRYFVKQHEGKPLYVVTYGSFSSRNAAVQAIQSLPASLKAGKPWARTVGSVQKEISSNR